MTVASVACWNQLLQIVRSLNDPGSHKQGKLRETLNCVGAYIANLDPDPGGSALTQDVIFAVHPYANATKSVEEQMPSVALIPRDGDRYPSTWSSSVQRRPTWTMAPIHMSAKSSTRRSSALSARLRQPSCCLSASSNIEFLAQV